MSYGCFEMGRFQEIGGSFDLDCFAERTKLTPWKPLRLTISVCCFLKHILENHSLEQTLSFEMVHSPYCSRFHPNNLASLRNFCSLPIPTIPPTEKRELFSLYGVTSLQESTSNLHTILHSSCCYCGSFLCTKTHYEINFVEVLQKKEKVWHAFSSFILLSEPFQTKIFFKPKIISIIFMIDLVFRQCIIFNVTENKVDGGFSFSSKLNTTLKQLLQPKNPLSLSDCCLQTMFHEDLDWKKSTQIVPEKMLKQYALYDFYNAIQGIAGDPKHNNYLKDNRNYIRSLKGFNIPGRKKNVKKQKKTNCVCV